MANGAAVRLLPEPPPAITQPAATEIEVAIGQAVASAATALCYALQEYQNGGLRPETRLANGTRVAALYTLQRSTLGQIDFPTVAREQGRIALRQYFDADFYRHYSIEQGDAVLDMFIDDVLAVVAKVTAFERAWAN